MLFPSTEFLFVFFPIVITIYYALLRKTKLAKNIFLLIASLYFYAWGEPKYVILMIIIIALNYLYGLMIDKWRENKAMAAITFILMLATNVGALGYYKYYQFILLQVNRFAHTNIEVPMVHLPIGISFFTFQAMSYVIDVYRRKGKVQSNPLKVGLYICLFPQLIAGPIVRYETVANEIDNRVETLEDFTQGVTRFIIGLGKKVLIANNLAMIADSVFDFVDGGVFHSSITLAWMGAITYTLQIFFDFAGYSDMAIGLGRMFGFHFEENFNYPYIAANITDFWRRWHISMQTWFRDYVYFPMGGSRVKLPRMIFNMFVVWLLTGIWHGANWNYIAWGLFNFVLLLFERFTGMGKKNTWWSHIYAGVLILVSMVIFRSVSLGAAKTYLFAMFGMGGEGFFSHNVITFIQSYWLYIVMGIIAATPLVSNIDKKLQAKNNALSKCWNVAYTISILLIFIISLSFIFNSAYNPFIYFNF